METTAESIYTAITIDAMIQAIDCMNFSVSDLQEALKKAKAVEAIILMDLIAAQVALKVKAESFLSAIKTDQGEMSQEAVNG